MPLAIRHIHALITVVDVCGLEYCPVLRDDIPPELLLVVALNREGVIQPVIVPSLTDQNVPVRAIGPLLDPETHRHGITDLQVSIPGQGIPRPLQLKYVPPLRIVDRVGISVQREVKRAVGIASLVGEIIPDQGQGVRIALALRHQRSSSQGHGLESQNSHDGRNK